MSSIGFLAGGAILRTGMTIQGLTTAAGLWLVTAIGMCAGAGMFVEAVSVTGTGVIALTVLLKRQLELVLGDPNALDEIVGNLGELGVKIADVSYERRLDEDKQRVGATLNLAFDDRLELPKPLHEVERVAGVRRLHLRTP